jgi:hypothetical protein
MNNDPADDTIGCAEMAARIFVFIAVLLLSAVIYSLLNGLYLWQKVL